VAGSHWADWAHETDASWTILCREPPIEFRENPVFSLLPGNGWMDVVSM